MSSYFNLWNLKRVIAINAQTVKVTNSFTTPAWRSFRHYALWSNCGGVESSLEISNCVFLSSRTSAPDPGTDGFQLLKGSTKAGSIVTCFVSIWRWSSIHKSGNLLMSVCSSSEYLRMEEHRGKESGPSRSPLCGSTEDAGTTLDQREKQSTVGEHLFRSICLEEVDQIGSWSSGS